ncbi:hypothetical protein MCOR27_003712 [Pyricularia oryzae]|uniref:Anaphase-promoting complex subunit 4 n=3 Tax=Pyricularia TaxID=48558 RepID=A0ABQ8N9S3_PYRGI|nr:uncharacterized protein MGG_05678 [Pyricularia oryzae 70-15]KAH8845197.1 hypothetical protein MCOR01_002444 [Pyricularia oryzae]KAI6293602.1 hypothetical protein MCOR33_009016 [Pyricularia grisea]EHA57965.1 hypothetical protein MGG_05678 [Pyricularia oryzae 70-15]KAI6259126.1 hypothetical protein MCOR19_004523 [Pyricularia oryzae]KAI6264835.1 hypothetical protein MCOR26_011092 [Pyricularia oryzae]
MVSTQQSQPHELPLYSASSLPAPVLPERLACSPTLDLLATVDQDNVFFIRRANGEQVSKPAKRPGEEVLALRWKPDGQYVAAAWSDGTVRLMGIESTKTLHQITRHDNTQAKIEYLGWTRNWTGKAHLGSRKNQSGSAGWDGLISGAFDDLSLDEQKDVVDFPREITFLEIETSLPKISPLPVSGGTGDDTFVFSSRASLEFVFREFKPEDADQVDVMIIGMVDGTMRLTIYDTFDVGVFKYSIPIGCKPWATAHTPPLRLLCHAAHPAVSTHSLLLSEQGNTTVDSVYLVPMDLHFVYSSPINLSLLASKVTILQKLLRYIHQAQAHMASEWTSTRELPSRFLANVQEDLREAPEGPVDIIQALYHTVLTGHANPILKEWLVDSVAERGHKRWDKAVTSGLENLRSLIHENMLPALERCAIILARLLGIARFHDGRRTEIGFSTAKITRLIEIVSCLTLVCHKVLNHVMDELELFKIFSTWLRFQIDRMATTSMTDELSEREATMDNGKVLQYISKHLTKSPAAACFGGKDDVNFRKDQERIDDGVPLLELLDTQIRRAEDNLSYMQAFPRVDFLVLYLKNKAQSVFEDIAEAERRSVRFGTPTSLTIGGPIRKHEMHVCPLYQQNSVDGQTYTAMSSQERQNELHIFRTKVSIINGISSTVTTDVYSVALTGGKLVDFGFLNADVLLVLWHPDGALPFLFRIPLKSPEGGAYVPHKEGTAPVATLMRVEDIMGATSRLEVSEQAQGSKFVPVWMEIKAPSNVRGKVPARICLLGRDRITYKVFAVPDEFHMF